ncbi:flagellar biosynthetic protein FliO, partial [Arthrospira platensis SPKY1]|nr:flagellar biosynthetic protein FliO [Arthrospira platensis SPKY1]
SNSGTMITFLLLAGAVAGLWWFSRKQQPNQDAAHTATLMKEVARQELSTGQTLLLTDFNGEYWLFSSAPTGLQLLQRFAYTELDLSHLKPSNGSPNDFKQVIGQWIGANR